MSTAGRKRVLWLTWERQVRNRSLSRALGIPLYELLSGRGRLARYASCIARTLAVLVREKPSAVVCQNPSLVLTFLLLGLRHVLRFRVAIDAHYGGVEAYTGGKFFQRVLDYCNRTADLVIVTNEAHGSRVRSLGGKVFVCPDPLPDLARFRGQEEEVSRKVFFICSFDMDEPYREVFRAAADLLAEGFRVFVSGNYRKAGIAPGEFPHVALLGFVAEPEYYRHLFSAQVVVDLTDHDNCLVCGAYEALEAGKPLVLSSKKALQEYFSGGAVFTANRSADIAAAIRQAYAGRAALAQERLRWESSARAAVTVKIASLGTLLGGL